MANQKVEVYKGQSNPYRRGSQQHEQFQQQRDWWMNNLNLSIIRDYLHNLDWNISSLEMENNLLHKSREQSLNQN